MQTKLLVANWKENPNNLDTAKKLLEISGKFNPNIIHVVPSLFLGFLKTEFPNSKIILQDISCFESGSHTGEISAEQAKNLNIKMSLVGHSETRLSPNNPKGDEDIQVNQKIKNLFIQNMGAILCIGEYYRDEGEEYKKFIEKQLEINLQNINDISNLCIAYEPVWAIGENAKRSATKEEADSTILYIKKILQDKFPGNTTKVIYGGSVDANNAKSLLDMGSIDGLLIGRASSDPEKWEKLLQNIF